jgi:dUTP pyrophosphatase
MTKFIDVKIRRLPDTVIPRYQTVGAAAVDLHAYLKSTDLLPHEISLIDELSVYSPITLQPNQRRLIGTGLKLEIPEGFEMQLRPRSGLAYKYGITITNSPGTIDSDFRGEVKVLLHNTGSEPFTINDGERICQAIFTEITQARFVDVAELGDTDRGEGGFGHTGSK